MRHLSETLAKVRKSEYSNLGHWLLHDISLGCVHAFGDIWHIITITAEVASMHSLGKKFFVEQKLPDGYGVE
jgi:hypothetical protein